MSGIDVVPESGVGPVAVSDEARQQFLTDANNPDISDATRKFLAENPSTRDQLPPAGTPISTPEEINQTLAAVEASSVLEPQKTLETVVGNAGAEAVAEPIVPGDSQQQKTPEQMREEQKQATLIRMQAESSRVEERFNSLSSPQQTKVH